LDEKTRAIVLWGIKVEVSPQIGTGKKKIKRITKGYFFMISP
jgi:hypothetical protein